MKKYLIIFIFAFAFASSCIACFSYVGNKSYRMKPTPENVGLSTFKVEVEFTVEDVISFTASGTGFAVAASDDLTVIMTAGHVCTTDTFFQDTEFMITNRVHRLINNKGEIFESYVVLDDDEKDVCLLVTVGKIARPIPFADSSPKIGKTVYYVGAPGGFWVEDLIPVFTGLFGGKILLKFDEEGKNVIWMGFYSLWAEGGSSGSPIFTEDGIIGMLTKNTHALDGGGEWSAGVCVESLKKYLDYANVFALGKVPDDLEKIHKK